MPRLLQCLTCMTLEKLPDPPAGVNPHHIDPGQDPLLDALLTRHKFPDGNEHIGNMFEIDQKTWDNLDARTQIEKEIWSAHAESHAARDTFGEDALNCFNRHQRPTEGCIDWMDESQRLGNPTEEMVRFLRDNPKLKKKQPHLCHFCPVASWVATQQRKAAGMYDN